MHCGDGFWFICDPLPWLLHPFLHRKPCNLAFQRFGKRSCIQPWRLLMHKLCSTFSLHIFIFAVSVRETAVEEQIQVSCSLSSFFLTIHIIQLYKLCPNPCTPWLVLLFKQDPVMIKKYNINTAKLQQCKLETIQITPKLMKSKKKLTPGAPVSPPNRIIKIWVEKVFTNIHNYATQVKVLSNNFQVNSFTQPDTEVRHVALSDQREKKGHQMGPPRSERKEASVGNCATYTPCS